MKKYEAPSMEIVCLNVEDSITTSNWQEGSAGEDD